MVSNCISHPPNRFCHLGQTPAPRKPPTGHDNSNRKIDCKESTEEQGMKHIPFLAPWKKNLTINTCNPAMHTINPLSTTLKLKIRPSVLLTVLKLRFSRVRKYFCMRLMVDNWPDSLYMDSSSAEVCSGEVPCLLGS